MHSWAVRVGRTRGNAFAPAMAMYFATAKEPRNSVSSGEGTSSRTSHPIHLSMGCLAILNISGTHVGSKGDRVVYLCPVCGYDQLDEPPQHYSTCPSCGTEF